MLPEVHSVYGNKVRTRCCGLLVIDDCLLMVNHRALGRKDFWSPPGGGVEFGETSKECLKREFLEETGLEIEVSGFLFACEFIRLPLHAVELFFKVRLSGGILKAGSDPEMKFDEQLIQQVKFLSWDEIGNSDPKSMHGIFRHLTEPSQITQLNGYLTV